MKLEARKSRILFELLKDRGSVTGDYLARILNVSSRTIRNDMKLIETELKKHGVNLLSIPGVGYSVEVSSQEELMQLTKVVFATENDYIFPSMPDDRVNYIIKKLLCACDFITMEQLADNLYVSKSTIDKDIPKVEIWLKQHNLALLKRPNYGLKIIGEELALRYAIADFLKIYRDPLAMLDIEKLKGIIKGEDVTKIQWALTEAYQEHSFKLSDMAYTNLIIHIAITIRRILEGSILELPFPEMEKVKDKPEFELARKDSIGGCCTDQVHREIDHRFIDAENIGDTLVKSYSRAIARISQEDELKLIVFNNSMTLGRQLIKATLYLDNENFRLINSDGKVVPCQINRVSTVNAASLGIWLSALNLKEDKKKVEISFYNDFDFNLGYKMFRIEEGKEKLPNRQKDEIKINGHIVETKFHVISIQKNGSLKVLDKNSGRIYEDLLLFEDCGDAGDTYDYSPVANDVVITSYNATAEIRTVETGAIYSTIEIALSLKVPAKLENGDAVRSIEMIDLPIKTTMTVYSDINRIDFKTEVINNACDHRLRVLFPSSVRTSTSFAEVQFGTLERPNHVEYTNWEKENWSQKACTHLCTTEICGCQ